MEKNRFLNNQWLGYLVLLAIAFLYARFFLRYETVFIRVFIYTISGFSLFYVLSQWNRIVLNSVLIFSLLLSYFVYPTLEIYGDIDFNYIASVYYTNPTESLSYINVIPLKLILHLLSLTGLTIIALIIPIKKVQKRGFIWFALAFLILMPFVRVFTEDSEDGIQRLTGVLPLKKTIEIVNIYSKVKAENDYILSESKVPSTWETETLPDSLVDDFVLVIGESVRKDFLNAYGFPFENTPFINSSSKIKFNSFTSVGANTAFSLLRTLAIMNDDFSYEVNNNILKLASQIGYSTYWLSNQGQMGQYDTPISIIAKASEYSVFLHKGDYTMSKTSDTLLIKHFTDVLDTSLSKPNFIVLHTMGSHPNPCEQMDFPNQDTIISDMTSCYNQTIKEMDHFLERLYTELVARNRSFKLIYISDHGVIVNDDLLIVHGKRWQESYNVPLLIWGNDISKDEEINTPRSGRDFLQLFCELNGVETKNIKHDYVFISEEEAPNLNPLFVLGHDGYPLRHDEMPTNVLEEFLRKER